LSTPFWNEMMAVEGPGRETPHVRQQPGKPCLRPSPQHMLKQFEERSLSCRATPCKLQRTGHGRVGRGASTPHAMDQRLQCVRNRKFGVFARCGLGCIERTRPASGVHVDRAVQEPQRRI
jgi:hypothetical protein